MGFAAAETTISDADIHLLCSGVFSRIFGESKRVVDRLESQLAALRSLEAAIDAVRGDPDVSSQNLAKLDTVKWLYRLSNCSGPVVAFCFSQPQLADVLSKGVFSPQDLAESIITIPAASPKITSSCEGSWVRLREQIVTQEATSVLRGLIYSNVISAPTEQKDFIISILRVATQTANFDIGRQSIRKLLATVGDVDDEESGTVNIFTLAGVPKAQRQAVAVYLFNLQRLQALVNEPEDINALVKCGFISAEGITGCGGNAVPSMVENGVPQERAQKIYNHALYVASRSERLWTRAIAARGTGSNMDVSLAAAAPLGSELSNGIEINLSAMFNMDSMGCEECASITGPAAFFVDLLHKLGGIPNDKDRKTLLDKLFERRADLGNLELSCANTKALVPYVDLVNEVLESVVWHLAVEGKPFIPPFDADDQETSESCLMQPRSTNVQVYS
ncbi:hypothetical protein EYZ11_010777 [Aspergillus tanneri]|uniref:Uncharacterized protein n=1 Tax=Aspergillus tanneri TaxID=1220188 RepID=A0A4S3J4H4_9EURO|nr:hypothetical protein EYZ11_010777 [Aspergillus tanneri]